jgi:hypothetical protein
MHVKFVSVKASYPLIRCTCVPNLGEGVNNLHRKHKKWLQNLKSYKYEEYKLRTKQYLSMTRLTNRVCAPIWDIWHIVSTLLHCGLQRNDQYRTQSASCSSSSVELSVKGTSRSVSESDGMSDGVGSRQTLLFCHFEGPRRAFNASWLVLEVLDLVACMIFFFLSWPNKLSVKWTHYFLRCSTTSIWL